MSKKLLMLGSAAALMAGVCFAAPNDQGGASDDRPAKVKAALSKLDVSKDDDWTEAGLPAMGRMQEITGLNDLKRDEVSKAAPGFHRSTASAAPSNLSNVGKSDVAENAGPTASLADGEAGDTDEPDSALDKANELRQPNSDPQDNENVGKTDLGPYETQTHTADQGEKLAEEVTAELYSEGKQPVDLANVIKDPIFLIEAAVAAMNADPRYSKNGELQQFMRHYSIAQVNIKTHQARLDKRYADATT